MNKVKLTDSEHVTEHIRKLPQTIQPAVEYLRQVILSIDTEIGEHIKWNSRDITAQFTSPLPVVNL